MFYQLTTDNWISIGGIIVDSIAIIVSISIAIWVTRRAFKDNLKQYLFEKRMILYSDFVLPLEYLLANHTVSNLKKQHKAIDENITKLYFLSNKEMYSLAIEFIQELEDTIKKVEDGKIQEDNQRLISICLVLSDAMKWEKEYFNDITSSKMKEIKKKYNMA